MPNKAFYFWPSYCRFNLKAEVILQNSMSFDWIQLSRYSSGCVKKQMLLRCDITQPAWQKGSWLELSGYWQHCEHIYTFSCFTYKIENVEEIAFSWLFPFWKQWAFPSSDCLCWHFLNIFSISCIIMTDGFRKELAYLLNTLNDYEQRELSVHMRTPNNFSNSFNCPGDHKLTKTLMASPTFFSSNAFKASLVKWWPFFFTSQSVDISRPEQKG